MRLLAVVRAPPNVDEAARALATASGLAHAEARMRLAPEPPALLARMEPARAEALRVALRKAGLAVVTVPLPCPSDEDRTVAHALTFDRSGVTLAPRLGAPFSVAWPEVLAILRGLRLSRTETAERVRARRFSPGRAVLTGGLKLTRTETSVVRSSEESVEQVILVYERGGRVAMLSDRELDFSCLGPTMQPSSTANMAELARRLREGAKGAFYDERLQRLGRRPLPFLSGGESQVQSARVTKTFTDSTGSLDALAEVMRQALLEGLLP